MPQKFLFILLLNTKNHKQVGCYPIYILNYKLIDNKMHKI